MKLIEFNEDLYGMDDFKDAFRVLKQFKRSLLKTLKENPFDHFNVRTYYNRGELFKIVIIKGDFTISYFPNELNVVELEYDVKYSGFKVITDTADINVISIIRNKFMDRVVPT